MTNGHVGSIVTFGPGASRSSQGFDFQFVLRQRTGFVGANHGGSPQGFHCRKFANNHFVAGQFEHSLRQCQRGHDGQTFGDGGYRQGNGGLEHFQNWLSTNDSCTKNNDYQANGNFDEATAERLQLLFERGGSLFRAANEMGDFSQFGVHACSYNHCLAIALGNKSSFKKQVGLFCQRRVSGQHGRLFFHGNTFTREGSLVHLQLGAVEEPRIGRGHVSGLQKNHVTRYQHFDADFLQTSSSKCFGRNSNHFFQGGHTASRLKFHVKTDNGVQENHYQNGGPVQPFLKAK